MEDDLSMAAIKDLRGTGSYWSMSELMWTSNHKYIFCLAFHLLQRTQREIDPKSC